MSDRPPPPPPPDPPPQAAQTPAEVASGGATPAPAGLVPPGTMRIDLHCHTEASADCRTPLAEFPARCAARGIAVQAITDHDQIWGAQRLQEMCADNPALTVIVGEEISSRDGEIIGLFLRERVPPGLSAEETVERVRGQGGLVLVPHGFDPLKRFHLRADALERIRAEVDIVETFNSHISRPRWNRLALEWAEAHGKLKSAGSDAHTLDRVGAAWVQTPARPVHSPDDLRRALAEGTVMGEWKHPFVAYAHKLWDFVRRAGARRGLEANP